MASRVGLLLLVCALSAFTHGGTAAAGSTEVCHKLSLHGAGGARHFTDLLSPSKICPHYHLKLDSIDVADTVLELPPNAFEGGVDFDSAATFSYLPEKIYKATMIVVFQNKRDTLFKDFQGLLGIKHSGRVDDAFPEITFHFQGGRRVTIYPRDYLLPDVGDWYYVGLRNGRSKGKDVRDMVIFEVPCTACLLARLITIAHQASRSSNQSENVTGIR